MLDRFTYLKAGLAALLVFAGVKILLTDVYKMPVWLSLGIIVAILAVSVGASLWANRRAERRAAPEGGPDAPGTGAAGGSTGSAAEGIA